MADALELVKALEYAFPKDGSKLIAHDDSSLTQLLHWTLSSFEAKMQHRTKSYAIESADNLSRCFDDPNAPEMFVEYVKSFGPPSVKTLVSIGTMAACAVAFVSMVLSRHWHL